MIMTRRKCNTRRGEGWGGSVPRVGVGVYVCLCVIITIINQGDPKFGIGARRSLLR